MILTPIAISELVELIANEVETRIHRAEYHEPPQDRIGLNEAMELTGLKESAIYKRTMTGEIPFQKFGKRLVFSRKDLNEWIEARTISRLPASEVMSNRLAESVRKRRSN
jgi:excisionase family DNA binding protein